MAYHNDIVLDFLLKHDGEHEISGRARAFTNKERTFRVAEGCKGLENEQKNDKLQTASTSFRSRRPNSHGASYDELHTSQTDKP